MTPDPVLLALHRLQSRAALHPGADLSEEIEALAGEITRCAPVHCPCVACARLRRHGAECEDTHARSARHLVLATAAALVLGAAAAAAVALGRWW